MTEPRISVVIVDDEEHQLHAWRRTLADRFHISLFSDGESALAHLQQNHADVVLADWGMPGLHGLELLKRIRTLQDPPEVLVVTGSATVQTAVEAMRLGAYDFLTKPISTVVATQRIRAAGEKRALAAQNAALKATVAALSPSSTLVGDSPAMAKIRAFVEQVASAPSPVLICGESGTGKELIARALHDSSSRAGKPFVAINCGAVAEGLIDSELFGHEKGAFTGAVNAHRGLFEAARDGTLFLDEIGDMPLMTQVRLLRVLQENEIRPVGSSVSRPVSVRVVAATHIDLQRAIKQHHFREDLFYRVSTFRIDLPPLRERPDDIAILANHLVHKAAARLGKSAPEIGSEAQAALRHYRWPGNVRELNNAVEYAVTLCRGPTIEPSDLPPFVNAVASPSTSKRIVLRAESVDEGPSRQAHQTTAYSEARAKTLADFEKSYLVRVMEQCSGNLSAASRQSGIDRSNLRRMLMRHNLEHLKGEHPSDVNERASEPSARTAS